MTKRKDLENYVAELDDKLHSTGKCMVCLRKLSDHTLEELETCADFLTLEEQDTEIQAETDDELDNGETEILGD